MAVHNRVNDPTLCGITVGPRGVRRMDANWPTRRACREQIEARVKAVKAPSESQPSSRIGENPPYGMIGGIEERSSRQGRSLAGCKSPHRQLPVFGRLAYPM